MFRVKICGVRTASEACQAVEAGADAVGLNFYSRSRRYVSRSGAAAICKALPRDAVRVGVFVNDVPEDVRSAARSLGLDLLQLHGDESPLTVATLRDLPLVRAFRIDARTIIGVQQYLLDCEELRVAFQAILFDSMRPGKFGGTGQELDWELVRELKSTIQGTPVILAGGLNPENVAAAIYAVRPFAVDVASGVEASPGRKDPSKVRDFCQAAWRAFQDIDLTAGREDDAQGA